MSNLPSPSLERTQRLMSAARCARYGTVAMLIVLFTATHLPGNAIPQPVVGLDKLIHCLAYLVLAMSALTSWDLSIGKLRPQHYFTVWLVGTLYGAFDEVTQIPVGRHCDPLDWLCDVIGIVLGLTLFRLFRARIYRWIG